MGGTMTTIRDHVMEFHKAFRQPINTIPHVPSTEHVRLRLRLIKEEFIELFEACATANGWKRHDATKHNRAEIERASSILSAVIARVEASDVDLVELVDAMADLDYVVEGSRLECGVNGPAVADEVHRSNMAKLGPDGNPNYREDGKVIKPTGWTPPDIAGVLRAQGWRP
jgi:predicted HAD superfamily Cof-like phosphohydrolase